MRSGRKLAQVCKVEIEGEDHTIFTFRCRADFDIYLSEQAFFRHRGNVVTERQKRLLQMARKIFVQFDVHYAVIFQTFSLASSAA